MNKKGLIGAITLGVVLIIALICVFTCTVRVPAGYVGVVYSMSKGISDETLSQGFHIISPTKSVTLYSIGIEQSYLTATNDGDSEDDDSFSAPSKDGKGLQMELTFTYRYDADKAGEVFTRFKGRSGKEILTTFIKPNVISWTKEVTAMYPVTEILGDKRASLNTELAEYLAKKFVPYGIIIENASLINIEVDAETKESITKKVKAQQDLELAQIERQTANINANKEKEVALIKAEQDKETAKINAEQAKIKAEGDAEALKISAEAEANANRMIADSITDKLIEQQKIQKWKGDVPQVEGSATPIIKMQE